MTDGSVTNPQARRVNGRRKNLNRIWATDDWKQQKAEFLKKFPWCSMHNSFVNKDGMRPAVPATIPHHPYKTSYKEGYSDLELSQCVALCAKCHFAIHHGMKLCPVCGEHYCPWDAEMCIRCFDKANPDIVARRKQNKDAFETAERDRKKAIAQKRKAQKSKSRCKFFGVGQNCRFRPGTKCPHAPTKAALNCCDFSAKKGVEKK
jgi:hypothetical protein